MIDCWMTMRKAAAHFKTQNNSTMIGESTIRVRIRMGFPYLKIGNRVLINIDTFEEELMKFTFKQRRQALNS